MSTTPQQWAAWFRAAADEADDLTEGQKDGFRIAAEHLESSQIAARVATITGCPHPADSTGEVAPSDICPATARVDGTGHSWRFDGDDPYLVCAGCDEMRDALTGRVVKPGATA